MSEYVLNEYFDWLYFNIKEGQLNKRKKYRKLISLLHSLEFRYFVDYDENRAHDGENMRWYFVDSGGPGEILQWGEPCTVLEALIGISIHMESIMEEPGIDTSSSRWFWLMIENLDLLDMTDSKIDKGYIYDRVNMFMDRTYDSNGEGNIFFIENCADDLREVEIWYQMCWYLDSII